MAAGKLSYAQRLRIEEEQDAENVIGMALNIARLPFPGRAPTWGNTPEARDAAYTREHGPARPPAPTEEDHQKWTWEVLYEINGAASLVAEEKYDAAFAKLLDIAQRLQSEADAKPDPNDECAATIVSADVLRVVARILRRARQQPKTSKPKVQEVA
jgi:hypothetical protein